MLKPALRVLPLQLQPAKGTGWRAGKTTNERGYNYRWQQARAAFLQAHPLCVMCEQMTPPLVTPATVVDHIDRHEGDTAVFWDQSRWQSLCAHHHSSTKQRIEVEQRANR